MLTLPMQQTLLVVFCIINMSAGSCTGPCSVHQAARYIVAELNKSITSSLENKNSCLKCNRYYVVQVTVKNTDHGRVWLLFCQKCCCQCPNLYNADCESMILSPLRM